MKKYMCKKNFAIFVFAMLFFVIIGAFLPHPNYGISCIIFSTFFFCAFFLLEVFCYVWKNRKKNQRAKNISLIFSSVLSTTLIGLWASNVLNGVDIFGNIFVASERTYGISMTFTSLNFIFIFLPLTVAAYYVIKSNLKNIFLVVVSVIFYAVGEPRMIWLLFLTIFVNYVFGLLLAKKWEYLIVRHFFLLIMLIWNFGLLFYYKYFIFTLENISLATGSKLSIPNIIQPLGISFFTFRTVSFCLDVYWETVSVQYNFINVALYICFFPQISMGPISKYNDFASQLNERKFDGDLFLDGVKRIIIGWAKKLIIANNIGTTVDIIFKMHGNERTVILAWIGILGYLIQLYYDFSGYTDIAIGIGQIFGFRTPENFNYPFLSKSVVEYWTRWHVSLGTWLKNYIYIPVFRVCQNKEISIGTCNILSLICVWLFAGVWHGAGWNYLFYGVYYCIFIILERVVDDYKKKRRKRLKIKKQPETIVQKGLAHIYFFIVLIFGQLLFRSEDLISFGDYVTSLFGLNSNMIWNSQTYFYFLQSMTLLIAGWIFAFPIIKVLKEKIEKYRGGELAVSIVTPMINAVLLIVSISYAMTDTYQSFIYFQF